VQGTGEESPFTAQDLSRLLKLAKKGITGLLQAQEKLLR